MLSLEVQNKIMIFGKQKQLTMKMDMRGKEEANDQDYAPQQYIVS